MDKILEAAVKQSNTSESRGSSDIPLNRGVELILNGVKNPKQLLDLNLKQGFRLFKRKISISFAFSFDIKKHKV